MFPQYCFNPEDCLYEDCLYRMPMMPIPSVYPGGTTSGITPAPGAAFPGVTPGTAPGTAPTTPSPADFETAPGSPTILDTEYTQGYLRTQIGKRVLITFLVGTNTLQDRTGILEKVGISYIILRLPEAETRILCDIYSIKFVTIYAQ